MVHVAKSLMAKLDIVVLSFCENKLVDAFGIAPNSSALQADADLSQLNVRMLVSWRDRTDSNRHRLRRQRSAYAFLPRPLKKCGMAEWGIGVDPRSAIILGGSTGFEPASSSSTVRCFTLKLRTT